jgi:hypothetical protein
MERRRAKWLNHKTDFDSRYMYKVYRDSVKNPVTEAQYRKIVNRFNSEVTTLILEKSFEFRLPCRLGYLRIKKCKSSLKLDADGKLKTTALKVDWHKTEQLWKDNPEAAELKKVIYHVNRHTDGNYFKWYWDKSASSCVNIMVYKILMTRKNLRAIPKILRTNEEIDYYA